MVLTCIENYYCSKNCGRDHRDEILYFSYPQSFYFLSNAVFGFKIGTEPPGLPLNQDEI